MEELRDPDSAPAVDPTEIGLRRPAPSSHPLSPRQLAMMIALTATAAAVVSVALADRMIANIVSIIALVGGFVAVALALRSRMASRILGYAIATCALASLTAAIVLTLPRHWFEDVIPKNSPNRRCPATRAAELNRATGAVAASGNAAEASSE